MIQRLRSTARALPSTDSRMILCASGSSSSDPSTLTMAPSSSSSFLRMGTEGRVTESQRRIREFSRHERGGLCISPSWGCIEAGRGIGFGRGGDRGRAVREGEPVEIDLRRRGAVENRGEVVLRLERLQTLLQRHVVIAV